jgi:hypothetical protein
MRALRTLAVLFMLGASLAQAGCARRSGGGADYYAARLQYMVGRNFGPLELKSVEADGNVLVITFDGTKGWRRGTPSYAITAFFLQGFCRSPEAAGYLVAGRTLRVDTFEGGESVIHGTPVQHCPHP